MKNYLYVQIIGVVILLLHIILNFGKEMNQDLTRERFMN